MSKYYGFIAATLFVGLAATVACTPSPRDDTDSPVRRSGLTLHTDSATGCQYLGRATSGLTPRRNKAGEHMGCVR